MNFLWIYLIIALAMGLGLWVFSQKKKIVKDHTVEAIVLIALNWPLLLTVVMLITFVFFLIAVLEGKHEW